MENEEKIEKPLTEGKFLTYFFCIMWGLVLAYISERILGY